MEANKNRWSTNGAAALATALLTAMACASPAPPPNAGPPEEYRTGPPDQLLITVLPDPIIERSAVVRPDGMISFDLIGDVQASGQTAQQIARAIEKRIRRFKRDARATVSVVNSRTEKVTVFGEVSSPGLMPLSTHTSVAEAIGARGGTGFLAWRSRVRLIRTDGAQTEVHRVNLAAIQRGNLSTNMRLQGGDIIVVPKTPIGVLGTWFQQLLFPFNTIIAPGLSAANLLTN